MEEELVCEMTRLVWVIIGCYGDQLDFMPNLFLCRRRSLSPVCLRPSSLSLKRKCKSTSLSCKTWFQQVLPIFCPISPLPCPEYTLHLLRACLHGGGRPQVGEVTCGWSPHLSCKCDQIIMRDYMDRQVIPPKGVTSPTLSPPPPCKQALRLQSFCQTWDIGTFTQLF